MKTINIQGFLKESFLSEKTSVQEFHIDLPHDSWVIPSEFLDNSWMNNSNVSELFLAKHHIELLAWEEEMRLAESQTVVFIKFETTFLQDEIQGTMDF